MKPPPPAPDAGEPSSPLFELHFGPRALVKSRLVTAEGEVFETGQKGAEVRWQQGAIAVCVLVVLTRLRALEAAPEPPLLTGERGSPARSLDNLLTKPGEWALQMFGERREMPLIRDFIYRKKAVSRSNPVSAVQWDASRVPAERIRIFQGGEVLATPEGLTALLRVLLEEFNPRRVDREWEALFPPSGAEAAIPARVETGSEAGPPERPAHGPWLLLVLLFVGVGVGAYFLGQATGPGAGPANGNGPAETPANASAAVVSEFIDRLNAKALAEAYALTTEEFREAMPAEAFVLRFGDQRYNFPRIAGNPYLNRTDRRVHEYRVTLYVETEVRRVPALEGLARLPVTEMAAYAEGVERLIAELEAAGVAPEYLRQLQKERLERPDAARYLQIICGLSEAEMDALFPEVISVTLDLTFFFELVRTSTGDRAWEIQTVADASERLVTF